MTVASSTGLKFGPGQNYADILTLDLFAPLFADARNLGTATLAWFSDTPTVDVGGRYYLFPIHYGYNHSGHAFIRYGGKLPDPVTQTSTLAHTFVRDNYARIKIDGKTMRAADRDSVRFVEAIALESQGVMDMNVLDHNRQLAAGDGSGRLAEVVSIASPNITLRLSTGIESSTTSQTAATAYLNIGDRICSCKPDGTSGIVGTVSSISGNVMQATASDGLAATFATGVEADDWIVRAATFDDATAVSNGFRTEPMGLMGIMSDADVPDGCGLLPTTTDAGVTRTLQTGTQYYGASAGSWSFQGIDSDANTWNQGIVLANSGTIRPVTEELLQQGFTEAVDRNNAEIEGLISHSITRESFLAQLLPAKRFINTTELKGGHTALDFNGKPWIVDKWLPRGRVLMLAPKSAGMKKLVNAPLEPLKDPAGTYWRWAQDEDYYWMGWHESFQYVVEVRERFGAQITDISEIR